MGKREIEFCRWCNAELEESAYVYHREYVGEFWGAPAYDDFLVEIRCTECGRKN